MIEFDQKTQEGLHAIDKFVASNLKAFSGAIDELSGMTVGGSAFPELLRVYTVGIAEKKAGDPSPITLMPPICWGPILVA
ncbi:MAG: hypothetical protein JWN34_2842, partial [Bryobacterales bacterium]|nr:hypothetical protein [Bryobacterales bacterium]